MVIPQAQAIRNSSAGDRSRLLGQVFTPDAVADLIAGLAIERLDVTVFDPCVGEGALLLAAGRRMAALGAGAWHAQIRGVELDPVARAVGRGRIAAAAGISPAEVAVASGDFLDLRPPSEAAPQPGLDLGFGVAAPPGGEPPARECDVALMNPPYTRQERLAPGRKSGAGLSGRAGLHAHFWVHLARFVRQGGRLGAITSATWLNAEFGRELRRELLREFRIHFLIEFERDVFPDADVEACVAILEKRAGPDESDVRAATPVRFVRLAAAEDLAAAARRAGACPDDAEGPGFRVRVVAQADLAGEERWGRFFLDARTAGVVQAARTGSGSAPVLPLGSLARIRRGITTGNNRVFLLDANRAAELGIEQRFLRPILRSPREVLGLDTASVANPALLLLPPGPDDDATRAAAYLGDAGIAGSPYLPAEARESAPLLFGYAVRARKAFLRNTAGLLASDNFFELAPLRPDDLPVLFALLNAVPAALLLETAGRGQGRGLLKVQRYELAALPVPDPSRLDPGLRRELVALAEALLRAPSDRVLREALDEGAARASGLNAADLRRAEQDLSAARRARAVCHGITRKENDAGEVGMRSGGGGGSCGIAWPSHARAGRDA